MRFLPREAIQAAAISVLISTLAACSDDPPTSTPAGAAGAGGLGEVAGGAAGLGNAGGGPPDLIVVPCVAAGVVSLDGELDESVWSGSGTPLGKTVYGSAGASSALFETAWSTEGLLVATTIVDPAIHTDSEEEIWLDDSAEVYLDLDHDHTSSYGADDFQLIQRYGDPSTSTPYTLPGVEAHTAATSDGWVMEMFIPWSSVAQSPAEGATFGFDVGLNIDDDGGGRDGQLMWWGSFQNYEDTTEFGHAQLGPCR
jgi:hypothetical protein